MYFPQLMFFLWILYKSSSETFLTAYLLYLAFGLFYCLIIEKFLNQSLLE